MFSALGYQISYLETEQGDVNNVELILELDKFESYYTYNNTGVVISNVTYSSMYKLVTF